MHDKPSPSNGSTTHHLMLEALLEASPAVVTFISPDGTILGGNSRLSERFGKPMDQLVGSRVWDHIDRRTAEARAASVQRAVETGEPVYTEDYRDGLWFSNSIFPIVGQDGEADTVAVVATDITDRKSAEERLRESEARHRVIVESMLDAVFLTTETGEFTYICPNTKDALGYDIDQLQQIGSIWRLVSEESLPIERLSDGPLENHPCTITDASGTPREFLASIKSVDLEGHQLVFSFHDVTDLKRSEERIRRLYEAVRSGIIVQSAEGDIVSANKRAAEIMGIDTYDFRGRTSDDEAWQMIDEEGDPVPGPEHPSMITLRTGKPLRNQVRGLFSADPSKTVWLLINTEPIFDRPGSSPSEVIVTFADITTFKRTQERLQQALAAAREEQEERRRIQEQLFHAQKMDSIGRLAGGIAHDFNNLLVSIMGYAELLRMNHPDQETDDGEAADAIHKSAVRAAELTAQLLGFARKGKYHPEALDANSVIQATTRVTERIFEKSLELRLDLDARLWSVIADRGQLEQVVTNLEMNARDAMSDRGTLTIRTRNRLLDADFRCVCGACVPGRYIEIAVEDTGSGVPKEIVDEIFEPFFTTKEKGMGTGLGLATVYGIVTNHQGHVRVDSTPGAGTTMRVFLPASTETPEEQAVADDSIRRGTGHVLVVDDEPSVRTFVTEALKTLGYTVQEAGGGDEALALYRSVDARFDLVLLDLIMPEASGAEVLARLKELDSEVTAVVMSGYGREDQVSQVLRLGAAGFLRKPFTVQELSAALARVLEK